MFLFTANIVFRELDLFDKGCGTEGSITEFFGSHLEEVKIEGESLRALVKNVCKYFNVDITSILLNSCDELGRLDVQTYTKGTSAIKCSYNKYQKSFRAGKHGMYLNNIIGTVTRTAEPLDLESIFKSEK